MPSLHQIVPVGSDKPIIIGLTALQMFVVGWAIDVMKGCRLPYDRAALPVKESTRLTLPAHADRPKMLADLLYRLERQTSDMDEYFGGGSGYQRSALTLAKRIRAYAGNKIG